MFAAILMTSALGAGVVPAREFNAGEVPSPKVFDARAYGATGDGVTLDTGAINKAIHAAAEAGGGRVVFSPGVYVTGTFELLSNVTLDLEAGAVIQGSKNLADYGSTAEYGFGHTYGEDNSGEGTKAGMIIARNAQNIAIVGRGAIDGIGDEFFDFTKPHYAVDFDVQSTRQGKEIMKGVLDLGDGPVDLKPGGRPGTMIIFYKCQNILVRDVTFRNAPNWTFHMEKCQRAVVSGLHILNNLLLPNNDGIDCMSCKDIHFSDCDIRAGDDDFAIVGSEDINVSNCSLVSRSSGIRLDDTRYSVFSNLSIHANRGIAIYERGSGVTANVTFSGIVIETQLLTGHWWGKAEPIYIAALGPAENAKAGEVRDVSFSNIIGEAEGGIVLYGDPKIVIRDISFNNVKLKIRAPRKKASELAGGNFDIRGLAANGLFKHDIPGMYCKYVDGIRVRDVKLEWGDNLPDYFSSAIECEDFRNLDINGFEGKQSPASKPAATITLRDGHGISIRNSRADQGAGAFLSCVRVTGEGLFVDNDLKEAKRAMEGETGGFALFGNRLPNAKEKVPLAQK
jgi:hypothetical protein